MARTTPKNHKRQPTEPIYIAADGHTSKLTGASPNQIVTLHQ